MPHPKSILVTGSAGRLGGAAVKELVARGHRVRGFDRVPTPGLTDFRIGDLTDGPALHRAAEGVEAIVHMAATPDDADFLEQLVPGNIVGVYHVFEAARAAGVRRLILGSSVQVVWGQQEKGPWTIRVDDPPSPRYWYAATKLFLEAAGKAYAEAHDLSVVAVRLGWCPRSPDHALELAAFAGGEDLYLSPGDAGRFFALTVESTADIRFAILYATSKPVRIPRLDLLPARDLIGYEPRDRWPEGSEDVFGPGASAR
jgi:nucleoside-diphosphate-sugar epimerase